MPVIPFQSATPRLHSSVFIAPDAWVIGDVTIGERSSLFFNVVVRGDIQSITIGSGTNLQEHVLVHSSHNMSAVVVGNNVTVGHRAILHGCTIGSSSLIGMGATILDDVIIGDHCLIGAHALITKGMNIPPRSLVLGSPGRVVRALSESEIAELDSSAISYIELASHYRKHFGG